MALFTDENIITLDDLAGQDSTILDLASSEGIDLARKLSIARDEVGAELDVMLNGSSFGDERVPDHTSVVVTMPIRLWLTYYVLELVYRDAFNVQLNERYRGKRDQFHQLARRAADRVMSAGVGIAGAPLPQPAQPQVVETPGSMPAGVYSITASWVNRSGEESCAATAAVAQCKAGGGFVIRVGDAPANATGWNVFVGTSAETMRQQNSNVIALGDGWLQTTAPLEAGHAPGNGQNPSYTRTLPRILRRG